MSKRLTLLPAVDVKSGESIRISSTGESSHGSALAAAQTWQEQGAEWIHLVDLDAAFGSGENRSVLESVIDQAKVPVQLSGGITDSESLTWALSTSARRINLGTAALLNLEWVDRVLTKHGSRIALALDVQGDDLVARGSKIRAGALADVMAQLRGVSTVVVTDITRDGNLSGPNLPLLKRVQEATSAAVIASGGIASLDDIDALRNLGIQGAVIGKALYAGAFTLGSALERAAQ